MEITTIVAGNKKKIERQIIQFKNKTTISSKHKNLVDRVIKECKSHEYTIKPMGSATKNTMIPFSDVDILAILPGKKAKFDAQTALNNLRQLLTSPFNPQLGSHSVIIKEKGFGVDVVPARKTKEKDQYLIPSRNNNEWIKRGQDEFTKKFNSLNNKTSGKLRASVKVLKIWNYQKTTLDLSNLTIEKVTYDALKNNKCPDSYVDAVLRSFVELREQISKNIKHPSKGPQLNKFSESERKKWKNVIERDLNTLKGFFIKNWTKILGDQF